MFVYALELSGGHVAQHGERADPDPERIAVGGDSAGGNPTAVTTLVSRDRGGPAITHQLLVSPAVPSPVLDEPDSYEEMIHGFVSMLGMADAAEDAIDALATDLVTAFES